MKMLFRKLVLNCLAMAALFVATDFARADFIAITDNSGLSPLQNFIGSLGSQFSVTSTIHVTQLGAFDNGIKANLAGSYNGTPGVTVGIFNSSGTLMGSVHMDQNSAGTQNAGDFFVAVTPFTLDVGTYELVAYNDMNYNTQGGAAQATFISSPYVNMNPNNGYASYKSSTTFLDPAVVSGGVSGNYAPAPRFDFASFEFLQGPAPPPVPEPSSIVLLSLGGIGLGIGTFLRRRAPAT